MADRPEAKDPGPTGLPGLGMGSLNIGDLFDPFEFVRTAWSSFGVPSSLTPTADLDELDRRIADLKTVEQWLTLNLNMLRTSVQALEIQRGTIAALKSYGEMLGSHAQSLPGADTLAQAMAASPLAAAASWPGTPAPAAETPGAGGAAAARGAAATASGHADAGSPGAGTAAGDEAPPSGTGAAAGYPLGMPGLDAAEWWESLHRQFGQITTAVATAALGAGTASMPEAGKPVREPSAGAGEGAPVARGRKTLDGARARKTPEAGKMESGRRGRRSDR